MPYMPYMPYMVARRQPRLAANYAPPVTLHRGATSSVLKRIRIATRRSRLALVQARSVGARLAEMSPGAQVDYVGITTEGDRNQSRSLVSLMERAGGKQSFVKALETALIEDRADLAVHSMKDVGAVVAEPFAVRAFGARADVRDALVTPGGDASLAALPTGAVVGTSSLRRRALLAALRRDLKIVPLRGNVDTRLRRLHAGDCDALLLASAGLDRLGVGERIDQRVDPIVLPPAPGQGALAVQFVAGREDVAALIEPGALADVERCVSAERTLARGLGADCAMPFGALCTVLDGGTLHLAAVAAQPDGERVLRAAASGSEPQALAERVAAQLDALGVRELLGP
jgi:hydroxymethylbilane synthase